MTGLRGTVDAMGGGRVALGPALVVLLAAVLGADAPAPPPAAPRIVVEPTSFDFGAVKAARVVQKEFLVRNHGRALLLIESVTSSCGCTAALTESKTVKPGGSTPLRVTLTAPAEQGRLLKSVLIKSNDPARPSVEVKVEALVVGRSGNR
jgi:hypothetical protein